MDDQLIIGTSLRGYVHAGYDDLVACFGQPEPSPDGKCRARWIVSTPYGWGTVYDMTGEEPNPGPIESNTSWHIGARNDETADDICAQLRGNYVYVEPAAYSVSALPPDHKARRHYTIHVEYTGRGLWAVRWSGGVFDSDGNFALLEPLPSERDEDWYARFRFTLDEALEHAKRLAPTLEVNGYTVEWARTHPDWR
jgi:hypothetical protein